MFLFFERLTWSIKKTEGLSFGLNKLIQRANIPNQDNP